MSMRAQSLEACQAMEGPVSRVIARLPARRSRRHSRRKVLLAYALLVPSLAVLTIFTYAPVAHVAWDSLHQRASPRGPDTFSGLANYKAILADGAFRKAALNNLLFAVGSVVPSLILAFGLALALPQSTRLTNVLRTIFFLPVLIPLVAAASLFLFIFLPGVGLIDFYIGRFVTRTPNWLGDPDVALWAIVGLTIWKNAGYYMLFFLAGLQGVPDDAYEAAYLEGATPWQRLRHVTLPYLAPTLAFVTVIAFLSVVTQVDHVFVLTKGGPSDSTNLLIFYVYQQAVENYDIGKASAATIVSLAALLAITLGSLGTLQRAYGGEGT